jgi:DNA polymerase III subunit epsilon
MEPIAVIDFETTGLSPGEGARATEVAAVIVRNGKIVSRYQSLMNAGVHVSSFITNLTGITNSMIQGAPSSKQAMRELCIFLGTRPLIAHNASFDKKFFEHECQLAGIKAENQFACSMLVSRRLFPSSPNHKLGTLVNYLEIKKTGQFHRALSDAEMTAQLLIKIQKRFAEDYGITDQTHAMLKKLQRTKYTDVHKTLVEFGTQSPQKRRVPIPETHPKAYIRSDLSKETKIEKTPIKSAPRPPTKTTETTPKESGSFHIFWLLFATIILFFVIVNY